MRLLLACLLLCLSAVAAPHEAGVRVTALAGGGESQGAGVLLRLHLDEGWFASATLERASRRSEVPGRGGARRVESDASVFGMAFGRQQALGNGELAWYWSVGLAAAYPGRVAGEATAADIEAGNELHLVSTLGVLLPVSPRWTVEAAARLERHYLDLRWQQADRRGRLSETTAAGIGLTLNYRF